MTLRESAPLSPGCSGDPHVWHPVPPAFFKPLAVFRFLGISACDPALVQYPTIPLVRGRTHLVRNPLCSACLLLLGVFA